MGDKVSLMTTIFWNGWRWRFVGVRGFGTWAYCGETQQTFPTEGWIQKKIFKVHYGKSPCVLFIIWTKVLEDGWICRQMKQKPKVEHFLWALNFMQQYNYENICCTCFTCSKKTWRKWTWLYTKAIARLAPQMVRYIYICLFFKIHC